MSPDRTKPGNRGTYVAILAAIAVAILAVLMVYDGGRSDPPLDQETSAD